MYELYEKILEKYKQQKYKPKYEFFLKIYKLLKNKKEIEKFFDKCYEPMLFSIRANTLKISIDELEKRLSEKWEIENLKKNNLEEAFVIKTKLDAGKLGNALEHRLGYYYVQSLSSMLPGKILMPEKNSTVLDCCAAPGSKTTHIAALMNNKGLILANDISWERNIALISNLQRCGVTNCLVTSMPIQKLSKICKNKKIKFEYILVDAPCSNEGTIRKNLSIFKTWNKKLSLRLSKIQKSIIRNALEILDNNGILVYSTCTISPEENEEVIDYALKRFPIKLEKIKLKIKTRNGLTRWNSNIYNKELKKAIRILPIDFDSEGFFIAKIKMEK
ncbi:MAG: RsmB/NOP family class I SAM-dependent RNA methyltransferase [Candidatus Pacearchaeota archaeon]